MQIVGAQFLLPGGARETLNAEAVELIADSVERFVTRRPAAVPIALRGISDPAAIGFTDVCAICAPSLPRCDHERADYCDHVICPHSRRLG
jgi:hypothetical protein